MPPFGDNTQLIDIFGPPSYDNFREPVPFTNQARCLIGFTTAFLILSWIFVSFRLFVRLRVVRMSGWDDLLAFLYLIFTSAASVVFLLSTRYGAGRHFLLLTAGSAKMYLKLFYILNINLNLSATFIKLSLLCQFLRIFDKGTWAYKTSLVGVVFVTLWGSVFIFLSIFPCAVISDAWNIFATNARCWGYASHNPDLFTGTLVSHNIINTVLDIYITAIPFQLYSQPDITGRTRLGLMVLLLMGVIVITLSSWRIYETIYYRGGWYPTHDPTWYGPKSILLTVLEVNVASICASVPIFWPVLRPYLGTIFVTQEFSVQHESRTTESPRFVSRGRTGSGKELNSYYEDPFVSGLVDPFSSKKPRIQSRVTGEANSRKTSEWNWLSRSLGNQSYAV